MIQQTSGGHRCYRAQPFTATGVQLMHGGRTSAVLQLHSATAAEIAAEEAHSAIELTDRQCAEICRDMKHRGCSFVSMCVALDVDVTCGLSACFAWPAPGGLPPYSGR